MLVFKIFKNIFAKSSHVLYFLIVNCILKIYLKISSSFLIAIKHLKRLSRHAFWKYFIKNRFILKKITFDSKMHSKMFYTKLESRVASLATLESDQNRVFSLSKL